MRRIPRRSLSLLPALVGAAIGFVLALGGHVFAGLLAGMIGALLAIVSAIVASWRGPATPTDMSRRWFLALTGAGGIAAAIGGPFLGRTMRQLARPDAGPVQEAMAKGLGAEYTELVHRDFNALHSGDVQLVVAPFNSANYSNESQDLVRFHPATSHASVWMYLEAIPMLVHAPGRVAPSTHGDRVDLSSIAPTIAQAIGFQDFLDLGREGKPLPGLETTATTPKVVVTFVIDGGGWNVLKTWPDAWPNLKSLMSQGANYTNAIHGSFPAVTACAHATIGTGAYPKDHGVSGHNIRASDGVRKTYGVPGYAQPQDLLIPTLADLWSDATNNEAWVGELGYQIWHLGMLGRGGPTRTPEQKPVAVFWDEDVSQSWKPHNEELYRLPAGAPGLEVLAAHQTDYITAGFDAQYDPRGHQSVCCSPPIVRYLGDLIEATLANEPIGRTDSSDLLFINYKMPDYTGHIYNMLSEMERVVFEEVDAQLGRLVAQLDELYPNDYMLIVTADHGQCPLPDAVNGVRLDPLQLQEDIEREFGGGGLFPVVEYVAPSEIFLHTDRLKLLSGASPDDVAAFLRDYRYRDNIGPYVPRSAIEQDLLGDREFAAAFGRGFLGSLGGRDLSGYGETSFTDGELTGYPDLIDPYPPTA